NIPVWRQNIADNLAGIFEGLRDWWAKYGPDTLATVGGFFANLIGGLLNFILNNAIPWSLNLLAGFYQVVANLFTSLDNAITSDGGVQGQGSFGDWLGKIMTNLFAWIGANYQTWAKNIFGALVLMFGAMVNLLLAAGKLLADIAAWFGKIMLGLIAYVLANAPDWAQQIFAHFQTLMGHLRDLLFGDSQSTTGGMLGRLVDWFGNLKDNLIAWIGKNKDQWGADVKDLFVALISKMAQLLVTAALDVVVFSVWFSVMVLKLLATILTSLPGWIGTLKDHFVSWITGASDALNKDPQPGQNLFQTFWNMLTNLLGAIKKFVTTDLLPGLEDIGGSIVNGIISGVEKGAKGFMSRVQAALHGQLTGGGGSDGGSNAPATSRDASVYKNPVIASWENGYPMYKEGGGGGGYAGMAEEEIAAAAKAMEDSYAYGSGAHTYCERFVANIEGRAVQDTAIAAYYARVARNQIQQGGDPPPGAEVYFAAASSNENQGHIGISLGNGRFESVTVDGIRDYSISDWNANTWGAPYLGWVPAGTPMYANGTDFHPGGLAVVGDGGGPELVNLPRGSQVIPSHKVSSALSSSIADTANLVGSIAHALSAGLSDVSAAVRQASSQPVQITKVSNVYIDSQYLSSEAEGAAFAEQMRYMGV
ncbi:MAG TPA: hypothetical protein VGN15_10615, partial [Ktedonobacteraceae bacterium]|nr:hypothetical protein [Ktedonobacteraceae bacterium]